MLLFFYFKNMNENHFNIVVIGSGVIGLAIAERLSRYFSDILVVEKEKNFNLLNDLLVILALININEIDLFLILVIMFGHISESIKIAIDGSQ